MIKNCLAKFIELDYSKLSFWYSGHTEYFTDLMLEKTPNEVACLALDAYSAEQIPFVEPDLAFEGDDLTSDIEAMWPIWSECVQKITVLLKYEAKRYLMSLPHDDELVIKLACYEIYGYSSLIRETLKECVFDKLCDDVNSGSPKNFVQAVWKIACKSPALSETDWGVFYTVC